MEAAKSLIAQTPLVGGYLKGTVGTVLVAYIAAKVVKATVDKFAPYAMGQNTLENNIKAWNGMKTEWTPDLVSEIFTLKGYLDSSVGYLLGTALAGKVIYQIAFGK